MSFLWCFYKNWRSLPPKFHPCAPQGDNLGGKFVPAHRRAKFLVENLSLHTAGRNFWWKICPCTPQGEIFGEKFVPAHRRTKFLVENLSLHTAGRNFWWKICPCTPQGEIFGGKFVPAKLQGHFCAVERRETTARRPADATHSLKSRVTRKKRPLTRSFSENAPPPFLGDAHSARSTCVLRGAASAANGPAPICESAVHGMEYSTSRAWSATIILRKFIKGAHLRHSPPNLLMIGNNYLKQLSFGARARGLAAASQFALRAHPT